MTKEDDVSIGDEFMSQPSTPRFVMCLNIQYLKENRIGMKTKIECRLKHSERLTTRLTNMPKVILKCRTC